MKSNTDINARKLLEKVMKIKENDDIPEAPENEVPGEPGEDINSQIEGEVDAVIQQISDFDEFHAMTFFRKLSGLFAHGNATIASITDEESEQIANKLNEIEEIIAEGTNR